MRSRAVVSSSSAARLTAPSAAISRLRRSISPCRPCSLTLPSSIDLRQRLEVGLRVASAARRYCAPPSCAACSSSCSLVMRSRSGSRLALERQALLVGARAAWRQVVVLAALARPAPLRARASAPAPSAGRPARRRRSGAPSSSCSARLVCALAATCCARGLDRALQLAAARRQRALRELRLLRLRARARAAARARRPSLRSASITRLVELGMALLRCRRAACRAPRSGASAGDAALVQLFELRVDLGQLAVELLAARAGLLGQLRQAQQSRPAAGARAICASAASRRAADQALRRVGVGGLGAHQRACALPRRSAPARAAGAPGSRSPARAPAGRPARNRARRS